jgi:hypothetical protein
MEEEAVAFHTIKIWELRITNSQLLEVLPTTINRNIVMNKYLISIINILSVVSALHSQSSTVIKIGSSNIVTISNSQNVIAKIPASYPEVVSQVNKQKTENEINSLPPFVWQLKFSAGNKVFKDISFANLWLGIVTELGAVYKSTDGGENWVSVMNLDFRITVWCPRSSSIRNNCDLIIRVHKYRRCKMVI